MKPRNFRVATFHNGSLVVRASTAWLYFAVPFFGWCSTCSLWWLPAVIGSLFMAFIYGRAWWRRILGVVFLGSVFLPWGIAGGWVIGYGLTMIIDAAFIDAKRCSQKEMLEAFEDEGVVDG